MKINYSVTFIVMGILFFIAGAFCFPAGNVPLAFLSFIVGIILLILGGRENEIQQDNKGNQ